MLIKSPQKLIGITFYTFSILWAAILFLYVRVQIPNPFFGMTVLMKYYGFTAIFLLYTSLLPEIIRIYSPKFALNSLLNTMDKILVTAMFCFALLHLTLGFFYNLDGQLANIFFMTRHHTIAILFGLSAIIFIGIYLTSLISKYLPKKLVRILFFLRYIAVVFATIHAIFIGSHFADEFNIFAILFNLIVASVILFQIGAIAKVIEKTASNRADWLNQLYYFLLSATALGIILLLLHSPSHQKVLAHNLKRVQDIGITAHISPDDEPVVGKEADIVFETESENNKFDFKNCNCEIEIFSGSEKIASQEIKANGNTARLKYTFQKTGDYKIILNAKPQNLDSGFTNFSVDFPYYVRSKGSVIINYLLIILPIIFILLFTGTLYFLFRYYKKLNKNN